MEEKSNEQIQVSDLIKKIEHLKHDVTIRLKGIVLQPIEFMNVEGAASEQYFEELGDKNNEILHKAVASMDILNRKWRDPNDDLEMQIQQIKDNLKVLKNDTIPLIREIVAFYRLCSEHKNYYLSNDRGNDALKKMHKAVDRVDKVIDDLLKLDLFQEERETNYKTYNLIGLLQEGLDDINADVQYVDEWEYSNYSLSIDYDLFMNHVLLNIRENINSHAFGTPAFQAKLVWEKLVRVIIKAEKDLFLVTIENNGEPFKGNLQKVFEHGYCHGKMQHSGIGLNSAQEHMQQLGGKIEFNIASYPFTVKYLLTIPR